MNCLNKRTYRIGWLALMLLTVLHVARAQNAPEWTVNSGDFQFSMTLVASVRIDNVLSGDATDQIGVFVNNELRGTGKLTVEVPSSGAQVAFIQVYSNTVNGETLSFKIYDASEDQVIAAVNAEVFEDGKKLGGNQAPYEVTNNTVPSLIQLSSTSFNENLSIGTAVATLSNNDPDEGETHTYTLVGGEGSENNGQFLAKGATLETAVVFDFEALNSVSMRVQVADSKGATYVQVLTLSVNDVNDAPTTVNLDGGSLDENLPADSSVGTLASTDQDLEDTHTYSLVAGEGDTHNSLFRIEGSSVLSQQVFDFETMAEARIRVRSTDQAGDFYEQSFPIQVNDVNDAPSNLALSSVTIEENAGNNALVGSLSTQDADSGDSHTYGFAEGVGDDDNTLFTLRNDGELYAIENFDFETRQLYNIRLSTTDSEGTVFSKSSEIRITDANEAPGEILLSNSSIDENSADGTVIGNLSSSDPDTGDDHQYTLIAGAGDEGNIAFTINAQDQLISSEVFDFEKQAGYSVRVQSTDNGGLSVTQVLIITINDLNEEATAIALSGNHLEENNTLGDEIGTLNTTDPDNAETFTYTLVAGDGDTDNASFEMDGNTIKAAEVFDHETQSDYSIRVRSTDSQSNGLESIFSITIQDINETPTALDLSNSTVNENQAESTSIGVLSTTDVDAGDAFVYSFATGDGDSDNELFTIQNGNELFATTSFDFETKSSYTVRIRSTDQAGESVSSSFILTISDVNDAPTEILLSQSDLDENNAVGDIIGVFSSTDQDEADTHTYSLTAGTGDENNASFSINSNGELVAGESFDFEQQSSYSIRVSSFDAANATFATSITITIFDVNESSTVIALSDNQLEENNGIGDAIGTLSTTDPDNAETFTYTLVAGDGDTDNASFEIDGSTLKAAASFDHESKSDYSIRVRSTDSQSNGLESVFTITIQDINETPTALDLSNNTVNENQAESTSIGTLSTTDVDDGDSFVYNFVEGEGDTDNELFTIQNGNELLSTTSFDFEIKSSYSVRIKSTDQEGASVELPFTLTISDANDAPSGMLLSRSDLDENNEVGAVIGAFSSTDQDVGDTHTYSLTAGTGDEDNTSFNINESGELLAGEGFNFEQQSSYSIRVTSTDAGNAVFASSFTITINNVNEGLLPFHYLKTSCRKTIPLVLR
ncbi:MAG: cadherin repeat domain-containing protein [Roseivirga sp.]|nr:cadherin repeat domain-containing protein [Roseivirga sp.]